MMGKPINRAMDVISSLSSGMTNTLKSMLGLGIAIVSYVWMYNHFAMFQIESAVWLYVLAFIGQDFASYWSHRFNHSVNAIELLQDAFPFKNLFNLKGGILAYQEDQH